MNREAKIGLFVLAAISAMVYFILKTSDFEEFLYKNTAPKREVNVTVSDASGIREDTSVRIAGVRVGKVLRIELDGDKAIAVIQIPQDMTFRKGAHAELKSQGILGERYFSLVTGSGEELADQSNLTGNAPATLDELTSNVNELARNLIAITENIKQSTLDESGDNRLKVIAANFENLTEALILMLEENRSNVRDTSGQIAQLSSTLNNDIPLLIAEMTALAKELRGMAGGNRENIDNAMSNVSSLSENMDKVSKSLTSIASKVDEGQGTLGRLVNEGETVDKLNTLLDSANESLGEVKKFIDKATDIDIDLSFRSEYMFANEATKAFFGLTIKPDDTKYYQLEGVFRDTDFLPVDVSENIDLVYDADGNLINTIVHRKEEEADDFVFNGLLAYKVGDIFLKGGLIESEAGAGLDYFTDNRNFQFSLETFDFSRGDLAPHGKIYTHYLYRNHILFTAGWDDFMESDLSSAMIGGGVRWKDEDLKLLFSSMGRLLR